MSLVRVLSLSVALVSVLTRFMSKNSLSHFGIRDWDGEQKLHANKHHAPLVTLTGVEDTCLHLKVWCFQGLKVQFRIFKEMMPLIQ